MLIFDNHNVKVYAATQPVGQPLTRADVAAAKARLLAEAFPEERPVIAHLPSGAPVLQGVAGAGAISITHSRRSLLIAVTHAAVLLGIDAETADRLNQLQRIAPRFLAAEQQDWLAPTHILRAWTIKEALYKAVGLEGWALTDIPLPTANAPQTELASDNGSSMHGLAAYNGTPLPAMVDTPVGSFTLIPIPLPHDGETATLAIESKFWHTV
jgi:phosphopantetheinyl transferase (holo-ACP synthase)